MNELIGKKIKKLYINEKYLKFDTDQGPVVYEVYGECCSHSVFYDFYGVKNLLENGKVIDVSEVELHPDLSKDTKKYQEEIQVYGYQITTESEKFGPVTSVVSFRNYSNGYYGGFLNLCNGQSIEVTPEIFDDVIEVK